MPSSDLVTIDGCYAVLQGTRWYSRGGAGAAYDLSICAAGGMPYHVVRCAGNRPSERISASRTVGGISCPWSAPAAREILSFIRVPPQSFAPAARHALAPAGPSFTHDTWILLTSGCSASRATACISTAYRDARP